MPRRNITVHVGRPVREPLEHGTIRMYTTGRCRCDECKAAWARYNRDYQACKKAAQS